MLKVIVRLRWRRVKQTLTKNTRRRVGAHEENTSFRLVFFYVFGKGTFGHTQDACYNTGKNTDGYTIANSQTRGSL